MSDGGRRPSAAGLWLGRLILLVCTAGLPYVMMHR